MVYGVDECRVCGKPIPHRGPEALSQYFASLKDPKPPMTEKQWRAKGFKAGPTRRQMGHPHEGCCFECQFKTGLVKKTPRWVLISGTATLGFSVLLYFFLIGWHYASPR